MALSSVAHPSSTHFRRNLPGSSRTALPSKPMSARYGSDAPQRLRVNSPPSEDEEMQDASDSPNSTRDAKYYRSPNPSSALPQPLSPASIAMGSPRQDVVMEGTSVPTPPPAQGQSGQVCRYVSPLAPTHRRIFTPNLSSQQLWNHEDTSLEKISPGIDYLQCLWSISQG